jgi:hypothetical protein
MATQPFSLDIEDEPLAVEGCCLLRGLSKVLGFVTRGESTLIPHLDGRDPNPLRIDEAVFGMEFLIYPWRDHDGAPFDDPLEGALTNLDFYRDLFAPTTTTKAAVIHRVGELPDLSGEVQVLDFEPQREDGQTLITAFDLRLPAGEWTPTGS